MTLKKKLLTGLSVIIIVLLFTIIVGEISTSKLLFAETGDGVSNSDAGFEEVAEDKIILKNNGLEMTFDTKSTSFSVWDKLSDKKYQSELSEAIPETVDEVTRSKLRSAVTIKFFNSTSKEIIMTSFSDSVKQENFKVTKKDNQIRVNYIMGEMVAKTLVPQALAPEVFDRIAQANTASAARRLNTVYQLYSPGNPERNIDYEIKKNEYPKISSSPLYLYVGSTTERTLQEITGYVELGNYTQEEYIKDMEELGIETTSMSKTPSFEITVQYTLEDSAIIAEVLWDKIITNNSAYTLTDITLLPNFMNIAGQQPGYYFIPDGSGVVIETDAPGIANQVVELPIFGPDYSITRDYQSYGQFAALPVYGTASNGGGIFAIVEGAAANGTVVVRTADGETGQNSLHSTFSVVPYDTTDLGKKSSLPEFNLYSQRVINENIKVRFSFFAAEDSGYNRMAEIYRNYLIENGTLQKLSEENLQLLHLDFTGLIQDEKTFLGVPYNKNIPLSEFEDISQALKQLSQDADHIYLRLKGFSGAGLNTSATDMFSVSSRLGGKKKLQAFLEESTKLNVRTAADHSFASVYRDKTFDMFSVKKHTARQLQRSFSLQFNGAQNYSYRLSYGLINAVAKEYVKTLPKNMKISASDIGETLYSDFNKNKSYTAVDSAKQASDTLAMLNTHNGKVAVNYGFSYTLPYADNIFEMPFSGSGYSMSAKEIPFYQMVVHGYINYSGAPLNQSYDPDKMFMKSLETGAVLYFNCITEDDMDIKNTPYQDELYSMNYQMNYSKIKELYLFAEKMLKDTRMKKITSHRSLGNGTAETVYENGRVIVVDYPNKTVSVDGESFDVPSFD